MYPLDGPCVASFVRFLGECSYKVESIECVVIPSLKRMNKEKTKSDLKRMVPTFFIFMFLFNP
jgi:hypothetical protein